MGAFHDGVPRELVIWLRDTFKIKTFIETGTGKGHTARWAAQHFKTVTTIDIRLEFHVGPGDGKPITNLIVGDSPEVLAKIVPTLTEPAIFWLDAHWTGEGSKGRTECPVLDEIAEIGRGRAHLVLIDDARYFMHPPPKPHDRHEWPHILTILLALEKINIYGFIVDDVVVGVRFDQVEIVADYLQQKHTEAMEAANAKRP